MAENLAVPREFIREVIVWDRVAQTVSSLVGKAYNGDYIREVCRGKRPNKQLTQLLKDLGVYGSVAA